MSSALLAAAVLLSGCLDGVESSVEEAGMQNDKYAPLIVKRAKDMIAGAPAFCLLDTHKSDGQSHTDLHKRTASPSEKIEVDWSDFQLVHDGNLQMAVFPIKGETRQTAFTALTMGGQTHKRINRVTSKLLVRQNEDKTLTGVVLTYIYDQNYYDEYGKELENLSYGFTKSHFTGFFITSRLDGTMLLGRRIENGKDVFAFRGSSPLASQMKKVKDKSTVHDSHDVHLFLHLNSGVVTTRSALSDFEDDSSMKCSFCGKDMEECSCLEIVTCKKCGKKVVDGKCGCPDDDKDDEEGNKTICPVCNSEITDGRCKCVVCPLCGMWSCVCNAPDGGSENTGGGNTGGGIIGGGGKQGGGVVDGGPSIDDGNHTGNTKPAIPGTTAVENAANAAVNAVIQNPSYGTTESACNIGVQTAFKNVFGNSNLPPGMKGNANAMTQAWKDNPKYWEPITLSEAQDYANKGYFVVAGYINPDPDDEGHVVVIMPGNAGNSPSWGGKVPVTMDTGSGKRWTHKTLNWSFGSDKKGHVNFYYYKH